VPDEEPEEVVDSCDVLRSVIKVIVTPPEVYPINRA
jgi:hypothetical protein